MAQGILKIIDKRLILLLAIDSIEILNIISYFKAEYPWHEKLQEILAAAPLQVRQCQMVDNNKGNFTKPRIQRYKIYLFIVTFAETTQLASGL